MAEPTQHWTPELGAPDTAGVPASSGSSAAPSNATVVSPQITVEVEPNAAEARAAAVAVIRPTLGRIGRYHVLKAIGEGGMGVVYSAFDEELDRRIAIKVLGADVAVEFKGRARLMREAQAMAKLSHPNVVHVYEVGQVDGRVFVAMEYIRGVTLRDWLDQCTHDWREKLAIVMQAGEGLFAAHEQSIVHRDFKPENVMVATDGRARVLDFGLARGTDEADEEDDPSAGSRTLETAFPERQGSVLSVQLTKHGSIMGTPAYMSPEQHFGQPTDAASDQFNFCVVLYEALFEVRPFAGDNRLAIAFATKQGTITPPPPTTDVPTVIKDIIVRGLAVDAKARWPSMRALLDTLRDASTPVQVRSRAPIYAIATLAVLVLSLGAVLLWPKPEAPVPSEVEAIAAEARLFASRARWVYPAADAPQDTALRAVNALRELAGALDEPGEEQAHELGLEFGDTLARLGDQYWDAEGGRVFARDFYAQALLFDGSIDRARERSGFLPGELAELRDRAQQGAFSEAELAAADELVELAAPVLEANAASAPEPAKIASAVTSVRKRAEKRRASSSHVAASSGPTVVTSTPTVVAAAAVPVPAVISTPVEPLPVEPAPLDAATDAASDLVPRDATAAREQAKALVGEARKLKGQGKKDPALKKMFEATRVDKRYAPAWDGLRDLHFQKGAYHEAAQYGSKAVKLAPTNGQYHLRLGEAHWKLADYAAAEKAWKSALALGVAQAADRLEVLRKR